MCYYGMDYYIQKIIIQLLFWDRILICKGLSYREDNRVVLLWYILLCNRLSYQQDNTVVILGYLFFFKEYDIFKFGSLSSCFPQDKTTNKQTLFLIKRYIINALSAVHAYTHSYLCGNCERIFSPLSSQEFVFCGSWNVHWQRHNRPREFSLLPFVHLLLPPSCNRTPSSCVIGEKSMHWTTTPTIRFMFILIPPDSDTTHYSYYVMGLSCTEDKGSILVCLRCYKVCNNLKDKGDMFPSTSKSWRVNSRVLVRYHVIWNQVQLFGEIITHECSDKFSNLHARTEY